MLFGEKQRVEPTTGENYVPHRRATSDVNTPIFEQLNRRKPWSLPGQALAADLDSTINVLVLRFDFQYETDDDPNTTGRGVMDMSPHPLPGPYSSATPEDSIAYLTAVGHFIDPPPHDSVYFDAHMRALNNYWEHVSSGAIRLTWDIFPPGRDSVYQLPREMSYYGMCDFDSVIIGLERYFSDCIHLADAAHVTDPSHPDIDFSQYGAIILFHAGSDRQNDIGFPVTCNDLFTGFIRFGRPITVDNGTRAVGYALMMPETSSQDNRATALNAVLAHEFGHQLGLVDLYRTDIFMSQLGDFALMDNNGFGTGVDFGFPVGNVFGTVPLYPMAWSRAFLGLDPVYDFRQGDDIRLVAAEIVSSGMKITRVPISENEYYLIENRVDDFVPDPDNIQPLLSDSMTNVILGPVDISRNLTGEYDALMPGSGMLIYLVDESVAALDYDGDGLNNFADNQLQNDPSRRFIQVMEADGLVNLGGYYRAGFGDAEDMFREDRATRFTPNTVPPSIDNTGNNTHVFVTEIRRDSILRDEGMDPFRVDTVMFFDVAIDKLVDGFPISAGIPAYGLSPITDDLDGDGTDELIVASGELLSVVTTEGRNFLREFTGCTTCPDYVDTVVSQVNLQGVTVPLFARTPDTITAGPVTGVFSDLPMFKFVVVGYPGRRDSGEVAFYYPEDVDYDGEAESEEPLRVSGTPIALSFGDVLYVLSDEGSVLRKDDLFASVTVFDLGTDSTEYHGICRLGNRLVVMEGDSVETRLHCVADTIYSFTIEGYYAYGPIAVDVNRDGQPEVVALTATGDAVFITVDTTNASPSYSILAEENTGYEFTVNPVAGDLDFDGYPEVVVGGSNTLYAFNRELSLVTDFPLEVDDRFPDYAVTEALVVGDIDRGGAPELVFPTGIGNIYSFGLEKTFGFPLSAGERGAGSALIFGDSTGGKLGYLGVDGWFYAWEVDRDMSGFWPMGGHDPAGTFAFDSAGLGDPQPIAQGLPEERFYAYPNPVLGGATTIRYYLGQEAAEVTLTLYDLSGYEVAGLTGPVSGGVDNEVRWNCGNITPGVYRCIISVDFGGDTQESYTDIAVIR
jgi:M6 family metalloprotease-like protein